MANTDSEHGSVPAASGGGHGYFASTHWSVVLLAGEAPNERSQAALERLCETYRNPICRFARSLGHGPEEAEDLTQGFFVHLLRNNLPARIRRIAGTKFRSFLLRCFKNFIAHERERGEALKRGGAATLVSLEAMLDGEGGPEPAEWMTADHQFERAWVAALLERVLARLEEDSAQRGRGEIFAQLQPLLLDKTTETSYSELGARLGLSEDAVKKEVSRLRQRYREFFREEVAHTVDDPADVEAEMRRLFAVIYR